MFNYSYKYNLLQQPGKIHNFSKKLTTLCVIVLLPVTIIVKTMQLHDQYINYAKMNP